MNNPESETLRGQVFTRRQFLTYTVVIVDGVDPLLAAEAVSSTAIEHPEWDMDEEKTWAEWAAYV